MMLDAMVLHSEGMRKIGVPNFHRSRLPHIELNPVEQTGVFSRVRCSLGTYF
jgi:hypothetical protein